MFYLNLYPMNSKSILILVLFLFWGAGSWHWYTCKVKGLCGGNQAKVVEADPEPVVEEEITITPSGPLTFNWSNAQANLGVDFTKLAEELSNGLEGDRVLEITGLYHPDETNESNYENMGWARAHEVKALLTDHLDTSRVVLAAGIMESAPTGTNSFEAVRFNFPIRNKFVKEYDGKVLIYFPFNSTEEQLDPSITQYLEDLVTRVKTDNLNLSITGHTDDIGNAAANYNLGLARANSIQQVLVDLGLNQDHITTTSAGEDQPMATNATAEGRKMNRRIELTIN